MSCLVPIFLKPNNSDFTDFPKIYYYCGKLYAPCEDEGATAISENFFPRLEVMTLTLTSFKTTCSLV